MAEITHERLEAAWYTLYDLAQRKGLSYASGTKLDEARAIVSGFMRRAKKLETVNIIPKE